MSSTKVIVKVPMYLFPSSYVNVYGAKFHPYNCLGLDGIQEESRSLEDLALSNWIPLKQNTDLMNSRTLGDVYTQSIVHYKIGVLPRGEQARVTFRFRTPPGYPNKVQIFVGQNLQSEYTTPSQYDWWEGSRSIMVAGDGSTSIDVYFRPTRYGNWMDYFLFLTGIELEVI